LQPRIIRTYSLKKPYFGAQIGRLRAKFEGFEKILTLLLIVSTKNLPSPTLFQPLLIFIQLMMYVDLVMNQYEIYINQMNRGT